MPKTDEAMMTQTKDHRKQIAFRFDDAFIARIKRTAKLRGLSLNDFGYLLFDRNTVLDYPLIPKDYQPCNDLLSLTGFIDSFSDEELANDPKLSYLLTK